MPKNFMFNYRDKLSDQYEKYNNLKLLKKSFKQNFDLTPCLGAELEFYLPALAADTDPILLALEKELQILIKQPDLKLKKERGYNQYEVEIYPSSDIELYPDIILNFRKSIIDAAKKLGLIADFSSKPFENDFGSSMHIHLNFLEDSINHKEGGVEKYAEILCHYLPSTIDAFLPKKSDYERLDSRFMAPTHISYGGNNRTTLIRIPDSLPRRIEHRLASANSDPYAVIIAILSSVHAGLEFPHLITKLDKTYGNAYDPQYKLARITCPYKR